MISDQHKSKLNKLKGRAAIELKRYIALAIYLWVLFSMFEIHRYAVLRSVEPGASVSGYRVGLAAINALIMAKVILIGEALHLGKQFSEKRTIYSVLFKSVMFALFAIFFDVVEGVITGLIRGKPIATSIPQMGGGGVLGVFLFGVMASIVLIPLFLFAEMQQLIGKDKLHSMILQKRSRADAA
jgi:hypothetical protein